jgi:hypothetical protein
MIERIMTKYYQIKYAYFFKGKRAAIREVIGN